MPRYLGVADNVLSLHDNLSDSDIEFTYRPPTTKERTDYAAEAVTRKGKKIKFAVAENQIKYGLKILTGIRDGDFVAPGPDGEPEPLSSDPKSPHFKPDWKKTLETHAADLVQLVGMRVFDNSAFIMTAEDEEEPENEEAADASDETPDAGDAEKN